MNYKKLAGSLTIAAMLLVSCSKKITTGVEDVIYTGPKLVSFNNYGGYYDYSAVIENKLDTALFQLKLSNTTGTASSPIKITLVRDNTLISEYNTNNGTSLVSVPVTNVYLIDEVVTIPAGQRMVNFKVAFNPTKLGGGTALGLTIAKVEGDGATVNGDISQNRVVINISALNQWDGAYKSSNGYFYHPTAPRAIPAGDDKYCSTSGVNSVVTELGDFDGVTQGPTVYYVTLTIDAGNNVLVGPGPGAAPAANPVVSLSALPSSYIPFTGSTPSLYTNKWDPVTKKFYLRYGYVGSTGYRVVEEVLTKQ